MTSRATIFGLTAGLAFAVRALLILGAGPDPRYAMMSDSHSYLRPAVVLRDTGRFAVREGMIETPEIYRTPGYPVFLIPFLRSDKQPNTRAIQWVQVILGALSAGLLALTAFEFWKSAASAVLAGSAFALDFVHAIHSLFILTDILFVFALVTVLYAMSRRAYAAAGLLSALAALIRPIGVYYPIVAGAVLVAMTIRDRRQGLRGAVLYLTLAILPLGLWSVRNYTQTGQFTFSSIQDANLTFVRAALVKAGEDHLTYPQAVAAIDEEMRLNSAPPSVWASNYLLHHIPGTLRLMAKDVVKLFSGNSMKIAAWVFCHDEAYAPDAVPVHHDASPMGQADELLRRHFGVGLLMLSYFVFLSFVYVLCLRGIGSSWTGKGKGITFLYLSSALYFTAVTLGSDAQARYRLPIMPALFLFAGGGVRIPASKEPR